MAPGLTTTLVGSRLDLASDGEELTVTLDLPDSKLEDLSVLGPLLPPKAPFAILTGSPAAIRAHMDFKGQHAKGEAVVEGGRVGVGLGDQSLRGEFSAIVKVQGRGPPKQDFRYCGHERQPQERGVFRPGQSPAGWTLER